MRTNPLSVCVALAAGWAATLMSTGGIAAEADAEILLNGRWAEQAFAEKPADFKPVNRLVIVHEDAPGDTKLGRCAAVKMRRRCGWGTRSTSTASASTR